jgi:malate dehydrogenase (oxaloacetate-decarboxylating)
VTLATLMAAVGVTKSKLSDQRIIVFGAGSAGLGITKQLRDAMVTIDAMDKDEATKSFWLVDRYGLLCSKLQKDGKIREGIDEWVRSEDEWNGDEIQLLDVVKKVRPTVLIGCSTKGGAFTEEVIKTMKEHCDRPIIFPLSNPSKLVEVDPKDANDWTGGQALLATGSPFPPCKMPSGKDYV